MELKELTQLLKDVKTKVDLVHEALLGNPLDQSKPGVILRLDRVEQSSKIIKRVYWVILPILLITLVRLMT